MSDWNCIQAVLQSGLSGHLKLQWGLQKRSPPILLFPIRQQGLGNVIALTRWVCDGVRSRSSHFTGCYQIIEVQRFTLSNGFASQRWMEEVHPFTDYCCLKKSTFLSHNSPTGHLTQTDHWGLTESERASRILYPFPPLYLWAAFRFKHHFCKTLNFLLLISSPADRAQLGSRTRREPISGFHSQITHSWVMFRDPLVPPALRPAKWH